MFTPQEAGATNSFHVCPPQCKWGCVLHRAVSCSGLADVKQQVLRSRTLFTTHSLCLVDYFFVVPTLLCNKSYCLATVCLSNSVSSLLVQQHINWDFSQLGQAPASPGYPELVTKKRMNKWMDFSQFVRICG